MKSDVIFQSTYDNIKDFIKGKDLIALMDLHTYIVSQEKLNRPPNDFEREFIKGFFSDDGWANHIQNQKNPKSFFGNRDSFDLDTIQSILAFEIIQLTRPKVKWAKNQRKTLKELQNSIKELRTEIDREESNLQKFSLDLEQDLDDAVFEGTFDKVEGFSNIYETLIKYGFIKQRKDLLWN